MELKNKALQDLYETIVNGTFSFSPYAECPIDKAFRKCDEALDNMMSFVRMKYLENEIERLRHEVSVKDKKYYILEKRFKKVSSDRDELEKDRDFWVRNNGEKQDEIAMLKRRLETVNDSRYKWAQKWLSTKQNLETKLNEAEVKYRRLEKEHEELTIENKWFQDGIRDIGYEQGQTDLWDALQNVNDSQPNEFDVECESMHDVIGMDLEDFLDAYKKWQEQKETDRMRKWLADFCVGRVCEACPLGSHEYKCGCGYSFKKRDRFDLRFIPDEDIKKYYEKARGFDQRKRENTTCYFDNEPVTFEASVKINADVLKVITGIKDD